MDVTDFLWGALTIGAGIFIAIYGVMLFKFALAAMGFTLGFVSSWWLLDNQDNAIRLLIAIVAGAVVGVLLFSLVRFGIYIAGAILGLVIAVAIAGVVDIVGSTPNNAVVTILAAAGVAGGGFLGPRIGQWIVLLATSAAGSLMIVDGMQVWYASDIGYGGDDPTMTLGSRLALTMFAVLMIMSVLSQDNARKWRQRILRS